MLLKIGTRKSKLALAQSEWVKAQIEEEHSDVRVDLVKIKTTGDKILDAPLSTIGGKGLFVKEIEEALLRKDVDLAVHSMKDVPAELPEGLTLSFFPAREDPRDAFISLEYPTLEEFPPGGCLGTSSLRRAAQLLHHRPELRLLPLRGNVDTRLRKLEAGDLQAVVLASAGLRRLGFSHRINHTIPEDWMLPAIGQGSLGLEVRQDDAPTLERISFLNHKETEVCVRSERAFLRELQGGCQVPMAAYAVLNAGKLRLRGMVAEVDGSRLIGEERTGPEQEAEEIGVALARSLLEKGAREILKRIYAASGRP
jgi:hydroxymethylbilane synthase